MWIFLAIAIALLMYMFYEFRIRKPDQIVLYESDGTVKIRKMRIYPRHFSLSVPGTIHSTLLKIDAEAKGKIALKVSVTLTVAAARQCLTQLIRVGGWNKDTVNKASKEFEIIVHAAVREFTEKYILEQLASEKLSQHLHNKFGKTIDSLGLDMVALSVQSIDPVDEDIARAMHKQESSRIFEQTEIENQRARIAAARAKIEADEKIAVSEHNLQLKKTGLKKEQEKKEARVAYFRMEEELKRRNMQFDFDRKEIELLKSNPQLMLLSPQVTRLAEASQNLRNARTVISLSPQEISQGTHILGLFQDYVQNLLAVKRDGAKAKKEGKGK